MGKIIFWIVVFFLVLLALRLVSVHKTRNEARDRDDEAEKKARNSHRQRDDKPATDAMVKCERCGVFTPKTNAVMKRGGWTCGDARCAQKKR